MVSLTHLCTRNYMVGVAQIQCLHGLHIGEKCNFRDVFPGVRHLDVLLDGKALSGPRI